MRPLALACVVVAGLTVLAPAAHVLEMPNKLVLDGATWLLVQQRLYRGWGPLIGAPTEIIGLLLSVAAVVAVRADARARVAAMIASIAYAAMIAVFFSFNAPVNAAVNGWTVASLPPDWPDFRVRWEAGHAIAAALALVALGSSIRLAGSYRDRNP